MAGLPTLSIAVELPVAPDLPSGKRIAVNDSLKIPSFASEEEEAEWWFRNR